MNREHEERVKAFMQECQEKDAAKYEKVCDKYPVQSPARRRIISNREITVGLLGLAPSRISIPTAERYDLETIYKNDEEG